VAMRILLIEDDADESAYVTRGLAEAGHLCDALTDGRDGLFQATREPYDVIVADRMLPGLDGLSAVRAMRAAGVGAPVLFLTALGGVDDRVEGLRAGGDDYLVKPFAFSELLARVEALARRPPTQAQAQLTLLRVHDLELDLLARQARRQGREVNLLGREFLLLEVLMRASPRVVTRTMLLEQVWELRFEPRTTVVETHVSRLRAKIDKPFDLPLLQTVKTVGYALRAPA
jgi:two-component system OmpR family response regulator